MKPKQTPPRPKEVELPHHTYQPSRAELDEDPKVDVTFEEVVAACLQPVKVSYVKPRKRNPKM